MLSWSDGSLPGVHIPKETTSFPPSAPSSVPPTQSGLQHTLEAQTGCFSPSMCMKSHGHPLPNDVLSQILNLSVPFWDIYSCEPKHCKLCGILVQKNQFLEMFGSPSSTPNKTMWKLGRETTAIWSVNQAHVCFTLHFQREKKAFIC